MQPDSIFCSECHAENRPEAKFCSHCRHILHVETGKIPPGYVLNNRYRIVHLIDKGGMGAVYKAEDLKFGARSVAIKEMSLSKLRPDEIAQAIEMFKQEAQLPANLVHPNIPYVGDSFDVGGRWYFVMAFIEGTTLDDRLKNAPRHVLGISETLNIGIQLTKVLGYLHTRPSPIIFRDLKPPNIMITPEEEVYLIDFGIVRHFTPGKMKDTTLYGTQGYASPEIYRNVQTSPQSDIYSLGATLHQMISGQDPQKNSPPFNFRHLQSYNKDIPHDLANLIATMVNIEPTQRPANMAVVKEKLEQIQMQMRQAAKRQSQDLPFSSSPPIVEDVDDDYDVEPESDATSSPIPNRKSIYSARNQIPLKSPFPIVRYDDEEDEDDLDNEYGDEEDEDDLDNEYGDMEPPFTPSIRRSTAPVRSRTFTIENRYSRYEEGYTPIRRRPPSRPLTPVRSYGSYASSRPQPMSQYPQRQSSRANQTQRQAARVTSIAQPAQPDDWFLGTVGVALLADIVAIILKLFNIAITITLLSPLFIKFDLVSFLLFFISGIITGWICKQRFSGFLSGAVAGALFVVITFLFAGMKDVYSSSFYTSILAYAIVGALLGFIGAWFATI